MSPKARRLPFYNPLDSTYPRRWPDYTLVLPVCAVGNIGQLACDLIISTLLSKQQCHLIGRLYSPALMSVVGPNAYNPNGPPTTSSEVYESKQHKLVIIQQRTSYFKLLKHLYVDELVNWIKESQFDKVLVLSSSFAQCNPDTSRLGDLSPSSQLQCLTTSTFDSQDDTWRLLEIKQIPDKRTIKVVQDGLTFLPGSGITKLLLKSCQKASIAAAFLVDFCSEGINIQECYQVVNIVDRFLNLGVANQDQSNKVPLNQEYPTNAAVKLDKYTGQVAIDPYLSSGDQAHAGEMILSGWVQPYSWRQE